MISKSLASYHTCQHSRRLRESPAIFLLEQPPVRNHQFRENLPPLALMSLKGFLISNLMGVMMLLIMLVGNEIHANMHSLSNSAGQCYVSVKLIDVGLQV